MSTDALLTVRDLHVTLGHGARAATVLTDVSLDIPKGAIVGLVGESGSGKSTLAKTIMGIHRAQAGAIEFQGETIAGPGSRPRRSANRAIQLVPQDPYSSLDPRRTVGQTLAEAIDPRRARLAAHRDAVVAALEAVALDDTAVDRYPHEFSGGQRQRIAIARALITEPELIVADEITSALDVSTQAEIIDLLIRLREDKGLTMLFITHNLALVERLCDQVAVLLHGRVAESGPASQVLASPASDYTRQLVASVPGGPGFTLESPAP